MTVLPFFPKFEEDELLYSCVARYHHYASWQSRSATLEALFGRRHVIASHDLPGHLRVLHQRLRGERSQLEAFVSRTTLLPYFIAGASDSSRQSAFNAIVDGGGAAYVSLGLAATRIERIQSLRFCTVCNRESLTDKGLIWWRREHQLPGSLVCIRHNCSLRSSPFAFSKLARHFFLLADTKSCPPNSQELAPFENEAQVRLLSAIALKESRLLNGLDELPTYEYRASLIESVGLFKSAKKINQTLLVSNLADFYRPIAHLLPIVATQDRMSIWVPSAVRKSTRSTHPLYQIALDVFLESQPQRNKTKPFGPGPWICRNPLAPHYEHLAVSDLETYSNKGAIVGRFKCGCGYQYTISVTQKGEKGAARYRSFGPLLAPKLRKWVIEGLPLREISRRLKLDPKTVMAEAHSLGIETTWVVKRKRNAFGRQRQSASSLKTRVKVKASARPRYDWAARDADMLGRVRSAVRQILAESTPKRVTLTAIERLCAKPGWFRSRRLKLVRTTMLVNEAVESAETFKRRRLEQVFSRSGIVHSPPAVLQNSGR